MGNIKLITEEDRDLISEMLATVAHMLNAVGIKELTISSSKSEINWDTDETGLINEKALDLLIGGVAVTGLEILMME
jgi:hypothetical protein